MQDFYAIFDYEQIHGIYDSYKKAQDDLKEHKSSNSVKIVEGYFKRAIRDNEFKYVEVALLPNTIFLTTHNEGEGIVSHFAYLSYKDAKANIVYFQNNGIEFDSQISQFKKNTYVKDMRTIAV